MFESFKMKFFRSNPEIGNNPTQPPSSAMDLIDKKTILSAAKIHNETTHQNHQIWSLKAQKLKLEQQKETLSQQKHEKIKFLNSLKIERSSE